MKKVMTPDELNLAAELIIADKALAFQHEEKEKRAAELLIANKELAFQNEEKEKRAAELRIANKELVFQNEEKEKREAELIIANKELAFQNEEKEKRAAELRIANKELIFQNAEKEKREVELIIANKELAFQNREKEKRAAELIIANKELIFQNNEKENRAAELIIANKELAFQNSEKGRRAAELIIANNELVFQNIEKGKREAELSIANRELAFQYEEKEKRDAELFIAIKELAFQDALINTTNDLMWSVSKDFRLIAANKAFINSLSGFGVHVQPGGELLLKGAFSDEYLSFWKNLYTRALSSTLLLQEIYFPGSESQPESWGEISFNPIYDGDEITGVACYSRDTTTSKNFKTKLLDINKKLETAQQIANLGYWEHDYNTDNLYWSDEVYNIWGVSPDSFELNYTNFYGSIHPDDREKFDEVQKNALEGNDKFDIEHRIVLPSGKIKYVHEKGDLIYNEHGKITRFEGTVQDITGRKELENLLSKANKLARMGSWEVDLIKGTVYWSDITKEIHETEPGYIPGLETGISFYKEGKDRELIRQKVKDAIEKKSAWDVELQIVTVHGNLKWIRSIGEVESVNGKVARIYGSFQDIDVRKKSEFEVAEVHAEKNTILESIDDAFFAVDKNWIVTYWNRQAETVLAKSKAEMLGNNLWDVFSDSIDSESYRKYHQAVETVHSVHFEDFYPALSTWYEISAYPTGNGLSVYFKNISERKLSEIRLNELNEDLQMQAKKLATSNAELERFAYVASHDLQEPLRMVTSFLTQLEKKYGDIIDEKGKKYIWFAVDGAKRMREIILDLLEFSRVGNTDGTPETLDLNELIKEIQILYRKKIEEKNAVITAEELPHIQAYRSPLRQVFQNLVSNALKYSRENIPAQIHITTKEFDDHWQFAVKDNGIGIAQEYFDKIFIIFQRLHNKDEYSGTGMGLAITKKIIENHGGKIWLESEEGIGTTFYFTVNRQKN